jgi:hypothetical protein
VNGEIREVTLPHTEKIGGTPACNYVTFEVPTKFIGSTIEILDISGRVMDHEIITQELLTKNISTYHTGMYFVGIRGESPFSKLIKN